MSYDLCGEKWVGQMSGLSTLNLRLNNCVSDICQVGHMSLNQTLDLAGKALRKKIIFSYKHELTFYAHNLLIMGVKSFLSIGPWFTIKMNRCNCHRMSVKMNKNDNNETH